MTYLDLVFFLFSQDNVHAFLVVTSGNRKNNKEAAFLGFKTASLGVQRRLSPSVDIEHMFATSKTARFLDYGVFSLNNFPGKNRVFEDPGHI